VKKFLKLIIGILLLPLCWAGSRAIYLLLITSSSSHSVAWALPAGFLVSVVGFFLLPQAFRTYVLGHEMTHAITGLLMGAKVSRMKVGRDGGHVELSKSNFVIALAPYFFPFYTGLVIAFWYGLGLIWNMDSLEAVWLGLVGLTWGFHVTYTVYMLSQHQPDVQENGRLFSYTVIYLANLLVVMLWMILIGEPTFEKAWLILSEQAFIAYQAVWNTILTGWNTLVPYIKSLIP
jgi:hypothetical protein